MKQEISKRMVIRVNALNAVEAAILPAFCEEMKCNTTCPLWVDKECADPIIACVWCRHTRALDNLIAATLRADKESVDETIESLRKEQQQ